MKKVRQLLDAVAVAHPVVAEDVAVVPEFLDYGTSTHVAIRALRFNSVH